MVTKRYSGGFCACRSPSFPVIQDSVLKGKLGIPEPRVNRLINRSVSCMVKNPKVEVFGYPPASTQAGVAPFNILVGATPPWGLLFSSSLPRGSSGVRLVVVGYWDPHWMGGAPAGFYVPSLGCSWGAGIWLWGPVGFYPTLGAASLLNHVRRCLHFGVLLCQEMLAFWRSCYARGCSDVGASNCARRGLACWGSHYARGCWHVRGPTVLGLLGCWGSCCVGRGSACWGSHYTGACWNVRGLQCQGFGMLGVLLCQGELGAARALQGWGCLWER